jgi:Na+/H+ antiporter NhaD/arsenite permease-like protein
LNDLAVASVIFSLTYLLIISERVHKTAAALIGGVAVIAFRVLDQEEAFAAIDLNVIFLLVGMMVIANTLGKTGAFQWLAIRSAKAARGSPILILVLLAAIAAVASAFLDNVTTVVLLAPLSLFVASILGMNPLPFLVSLVFASNIGGTATLIGDPPNILIGSAANLNFMDFIVHAAPIVLLVLVVYLAAMFLLFRRQLTASPQAVGRVMQLDESEAITDRPLLQKSLVVLALVVVAFLLHGPLALEPATIALGGATVLIIIGRQHPHDALREVEWTTIFFFVGLFVVVKGAEEAGLLEHLGDGIIEASGGHEWAAAMLTLWPAGVMSSIVNQIPYSAAMIPVVEQVNTELGLGASDSPLWWALALGVGFGANLTPVGAAANVLVLNTAERAGYKISFLEFLKYGGLVTLVSLALATVYLWLRYLL